MEAAAEDSQEATVTKTLSELTSLVVSALETLPQNQDTEEENRGTSNLILTIDDSILSEVGRGTGDDSAGAMVGSDLGSTVAAIMFHASVLRSRHVAVRKIKSYVLRLCSLKPHI